MSSLERLRDNMQRLREMPRMLSLMSRRTSSRSNIASRGESDVGVSKYRFRKHV